MQVSFLIVYAIVRGNKLVVAAAPREIGGEEMTYGGDADGPELLGGAFRCPLFFEQAVFPEQLSDL